VILYLPRSLLTSIEYPIGVVGKKREETGAGGGSLGSNERRSKSGEGEEVRKRGEDEQVVCFEEEECCF
jgi:hypothetical protein